MRIEVPGLLPAGDGVIQFEVRGTPQPQGSTRSFVAGGRAITTSDNPNLREWRQLVRDCAQDQAPPALWRGPVAMTLRFTLLRPPSVSAKRRPYPTTKPDADKLARAVWDALKGIVYADDSQVVRLALSKDYGEAPGVSVGVEVL
jgi:Holliday junction resolvase RusA-like endonuclease